METVLNAFRHHRDSHANGVAYNGIQRQCSTPFGIIEIVTML
jgi:hypothetical protein